MRPTTIAMVAAFAVVLTACSTGTILDPPTTTEITNPATYKTIEASSSARSSDQSPFAAQVVQPFDSCSEFLDYVQGHAIDRVGPYGLGGYGVDFASAAFAEEFATDSSVQTSAASADSGGRLEYSRTNVQVAGVDEPDMVKTDGERIFAVAHGRLYWIDSSETPEIVASMQIDGWGQQLFLSGDRLLVLTSEGGYGGEPFIDGRDVSNPSGGHAQRVVLTQVDVSDPASLEPVTTLTLDGTILSSRMADGSIRVVVQSSPMGFDWVYPQGSGIRSEQQAIDANKELVEDSTIENWVPWFVLVDHRARTTSDGPLLGCDQVGHPDDFSGLSMMSILSIDLEEGLAPGDGIGLLAQGQTLYASHDNLYIATSPLNEWQRPLLKDEIDRDEQFSTEIHVFDITDPRTATYVASGDVEGALLSQWSMDEYEGTLRVVVTDESPWFDTSDVPDTAVVTMQRQGDELVEIGSVDGLGKNERVYAVRFIENKGYVVTFRQVDPLYVVDLADPTKPEVTGELKINGYSAYLHPIGEDLLLGVGQDATDEGRMLGTQVSVFDVSNPTDPRRLSRMTFEDAYSDAEWDHHAFMWWAPEEITVLPLQRWSWDERTGTEGYFSGAAVLTASPERVKQIGEVTHPTGGEVDCEDCERWSPPINRSVVIGDMLFTFSELGALASDLDSLEDVSWMPFG